MSRPHFLISAFAVTARFLGNILFFPIWWYSLGFIRFAGKIIYFWRSEQQALGFSVWLKNIFVPMYGQNDFAGRLISFFIRLIQVIVRGLALIFWLLVGLILMAVWLALPFGILIATAFQLLEV